MTNDKYTSLRNAYYAGYCYPGAEGYSETCPYPNGSKEAEEFYRGRRDRELNEQANEVFGEAASW